MSEDNIIKKENKEITFDTGFFDPLGINPNPLNNNPYSDTYKNLAKFWASLPSYSMMKQVAKSILTL